MSAPLLPPVGWDGQPLALFIEFRDEDDRLQRHPLHWPAATPLPREGDVLTRQGYVRPVSGTTNYRTAILEHLVLRVRWETIPAHNAIDRAMLSALVLVLSEGGSP